MMTAFVNLRQAEDLIFAAGPGVIPKRIYQLSSGFPFVVRMPSSVLYQALRYDCKGSRDLPSRGVNGLIEISVPKGFG